MGRNSKNNRDQKRKQLRQQKMRSEVARREAQSRVPKKPSDLIEGLTTDVLNLLQYKIQLKSYLDQRLQFARDMREKNPAKFNDLRVEEFEALEKDFEPLDKAIRDLAGAVGTMDDMVSMNEKMLFFADNIHGLTEAQLKFDVLSRKMAELDAHFHSTFQKIMNITPPETDPETDPTIFSEGQEGTAMTDTTGREGELNIPLTPEEVKEVMDSQHELSTPADETEKAPDTTA